MNDFDKAARHLVKADATGHIRWLSPRLADRFRFRRWLDAQSAPRPGEPDRRCDTIAEVEDATGASGLRALVVELFTDPDANATPRSLQYLGRFAEELRHGPHDRDRYNFSAAMVFLTTAPAVLEVVSDFPDDDPTLAFRPMVRILSAESAVATLAGFRDNRLGWGLLGWCPLMQGGQDADFIRDWRAVVENLSDLGVQRLLLDVACVFAQLTDSADLWKEGVKDMLVRESIIMREERDKAKLQTRREALLEVLAARFSVPVEVREHIERQTDVAELARWLPLAATVQDIDAFRAAVGL